jgi:hypothetical protein
MTMTNDTQTDAPEAAQADAPQTDAAPQADAPQAEAPQVNTEALARDFAARQRGAARQAMFVQMRIQMQATIMNGILASMAPENDAVSVARAGRIADAILADNGITRE